MKIFRSLVILFLIGLFLATGIIPGFSPNIIGNNNNSVAFNQAQQQSKLTEARNLVRQGREYYQVEKYQEAIAKLEQAADIFTQLEESSSESITRSNLSLAYQQLSQWKEAKNAISKSLSLLEFNDNLDYLDQGKIIDLTEDKLQIIAKVINIYGRLQYFQDNPDKALASWQLATKIYQRLDNTQGVVSTQINQVQALQALGLYQEAKKAIGTVEKNLDYLPDNLKFKSLISLGNVFRTTGDLANSEKFLQESLELAQSTKSLKNITTSYLSLADTWQTWGNLEREIELPIRYEYFPWRCDIAESLSLSETPTNFYQKAETKYREVLESQKVISSTKGIKAQLNLLKLLITNRKWSEAEELSRKIQLSNLANSRTKVYAHLNFAKSLACLKQQNSLENSSWEKITNLIKTAIQEAKVLQDKRAKSYAMGNLGGLYEYFALLAQQQQQSNQAQRWRQQAEQLTQQALYIAQPSEMPDIAYQWQWQLGRLFKAEGNTLESINYYQSAVQTLESVRRDLLTINSDVQFSFRDNIEPVYRQLAQLLLEQPIARNLTQTRQVIENLQLAELENFLRCNLETTQALDNIANRLNATEAIIYPILLDGQIDVILKLPNSDELKYHNTKVSTEIVETVLQRLQVNLAKPHTRKQVQADANQIYQWLIEPIAEDLEAAKVDTLVFFLDTALRNIPMATLYDGNKYLIENYAVAITSGLELLEPRRSERKQLNAMLAGLTESRQNYPPLKNVDQQFNQVSAEISSQILLNEEFTVSSFQNQLESLPFPVVHIATHGQFSSQPEQTFILAWDNLIDLNQLSSLLKNSETTKSEPIELLVLAACETAQGDKRATLGLAGVAINAGAKSTLATLWKVSADESPGILLSQFYRELINNPNLTKAQALRHAQLEFLKDDSRNRPYFWSPYVLLGNWL
ncbi:MAG: CHAT domain-containing protein [Xenococcaceae cyanobacterium MO_167.B52]|nr:CHAT domain-containing protein [Xenococcaceae cyanobacterium MO_167.B52]